jgi:hypothetical protein
VDGLLTGEENLHLMADLHHLEAGRLAIAEKAAGLGGRLLGRRSVLPGGRNAIRSLPGPGAGWTGNS